MKMILLSQAAKRLLPCLLVLFLWQPLHAQTTVFAELKGNPLNTNGWRLAGQAYAGDTGGDADTDRDELVLTDPLNFTSGAVFYQSALNLATCQRWTAEFDFRMWEGTAADGIAFCFLANPPTGAVAGGGIGIPPRPRGLMVVLDTWQNCLGATPVPNVQIRFEQGQRDYSECPQPAQPTSATLPLRSNEYQRCRITYQNGLVIVSINGTPVVRGQFTINFPGYFGFTAATGGSTDRHSIKNFTMLTDPVVAASAFAGNDLTACNGQTIQIGTPPVPGEQYRYSWFPTTGLSNPNIPNPTLTVTNNSPQPLRLSYFVTKDTLAGGNICGRVDEIIVNVPGRVANAGPDALACSGVPFQNAPQALSGYRYQWTALDGSPLSLLSNPQLASPTFTPVNNGTEPIKLRYVQTATLIAPPGCSNSDTVEITVAPAITRGIKTFRLCSGQMQQIGIAPVQGFAYTWSPAAGLSSSTVANPTFTGLVVNDADSVVRRYVLTVQAANSCLVRDTVEVRVLRNVTANAGPDLQICGDTTVRLGVAPQSGLRYQWSPATGLSDAALANPLLRINATAQEQQLRYILTVSNALGSCTRRDTVLIRVAPRIAQPVGRRTLRVCAGDAVSLGFERIAGLRYRWSPAMGLSSDTIANPTLRTTATITADSVQTRYILTISNNNCLVRDTTDVIVYRRPQAQAGADVQVCAGQPVRLGSAPVAGQTYLWTPATDLSSATVANPLATIQHNGNTPLVRTYILRVRNAQGCESRDTVQITVSRQPAAPNISRTVRVCSGDTVRIGSAPMEGSRYSWMPAANLSAANVANPIFRLTLSDTVARTLTYIRRDSAGICSRTDTFLITITPRLPKLQVQGAITACPGVQNIAYRIANPRAGLTYRWQVTGGTLVSGQGTAAIQVNWGAANPQASVSAQYADAALCTFGGDTLRVAVGLNLQPPRPIGEADTLCVTAAGNIRYQLPVSNTNAVYQWFTQGGGTITSGQGTNAVVINWRNVVFPAGSTAALPVKVWVTETLTTAAARCFGTSDTLTVWLKPAPSATAITGSNTICEGSTATYQVNGAAHSRYRWEVQGGTILSGNGTPTVTIRWNNLNGSLQPLQGRVQAIETTALGCVGEAINLPVTVHPLPRPRLVQSDSLICANRLGGYRYEVAGLSGSRFSWQISGGTITEASADSSRIIILWNNTLPKQLRVRERSATGCLSAALLNVPVYFDATAIRIWAVSVVPTDDTQVQVRFRISGSPDLPQVFQVERRTGSGNFTPAGTVRATDTLFTDSNLNTDANRYEYRIVRSSQTGNCSTDTGNPHTTLQLNAEARENTISLTWTAYQGWPQVARYEVWRKLDDATAFTRIGIANTLNFNGINALDGFRHCLRIRAIEAGTGRESWSNEICLDFEHAISIPNVITPNNDGRNDRFIIPQLPLYRSHTLELFNRWGGLLLSTDNYKQDWDGEGLPAGTYYYRLQANRPLPDGSLQPFEFKGWLQVIRD